MVDIVIDVDGIVLFDVKSRICWERTGAEIVIRKDIT